MKNLKIALIIISILATASFWGCEDTKDNPVTPSGKTVTFKSTPAGAQITINGKSVGVTPLTMDTLKTGTVYTVKYTANRYYDTTFTVTPTSALTETFEVALKSKFTPGVLIKSTPAAVDVYLGSVKVGVTPLTIDTLKAGSSYSFTLKGAVTLDSTFNYVANASKIDTLSIALKGATVSFTEIIMWESSDPSASHPSGLSLAQGRAVSYADSMKNIVDLFYYSNRTDNVYEIRTSARGRVTAFKKGGTILSDGTDAPVKDATWVTGFKDNEANNYFFAYDNDKHYSKIKIIGNGGNGDTGNPYWVKVQWIYNKAVDNVYFK